MQFHRGRYVLASVALSLVALADEQPNAPALPEARLLARSDALASFCAKVDPPAAAIYQDQIKRMAQSTSVAALTRVRSGDEYRKVHTSIAVFLDKVDAHNAKRTCAAYLVKRK